MIFISIQWQQSGLIVSSGKCSISLPSNEKNFFLGNFVCHTAGYAVICDDMLIKIVNTLPESHKTAIYGVPPSHKILR